MKKIISSLFAAALTLSAFSAIAAPNTATMVTKQMDLNGDGFISKDEYMAYHEGAYDNMKPSDAGVKVSAMNAAIKNGFYRNSMNNKPIGTTTGKSHNGSTDDTKIGQPVNGTHTGTNN